MSNFSLANRIEIVNPAANVDATYGPYESTTAACAAILEALREPGRTVGIQEGGTGPVVEYWWPEGLTDGDLVIKTAGSSGTGGGITAITGVFDRNNLAINDIAQVSDTPIDGITIADGHTYLVLDSTDAGEIGKVYSAAVSGIDITWTVVDALGANSGAAGDTVYVVSGATLTRYTNTIWIYNGTTWKTVNNPTFETIAFYDPNDGSIKGLMSWNPDEETIDLVQNGAVLQLGQEVQIHVTKDGNAIDINNGEAVAATGTTGGSGKITVCKAALEEYNYCMAQQVPGWVEVTEIPAKQIIGVATEDIVNNGKVTAFGKINDVPGSPYTEKTIYYVDEGSGGLTATPPTDGLLMPIAFAINSDTLMVRVTPINERDILKGVTAYGWGNHADAGYALSSALGTAAYEAATSFATAAQGALADSAVQPGDLAEVATTGSYLDLGDTPANLSQFTNDQGYVTMLVDTAYSDLAGATDAFTFSDSTTITTEIKKRNISSDCVITITSTKDYSRQLLKLKSTGNNYVVTFSGVVPRNGVAAVLDDSVADLIHIIEFFGDGTYDYNLQEA